MKRYLPGFVVAVLAGTLAGALVGYMLQEANGHQGWALVVGSLGANAGAFWAVWRRAAGKPIWRQRAE
jgi:F0F1-type ATP synthase assembly protein I